MSLLGERSLVFKVFKPAELVVPEDVVKGVESVLTGAPAPEHLSVVTQQVPVAAAAAAMAQLQVPQARQLELLCGDADDGEAMEEG